MQSLLQDLEREAGGGGGAAANHARTARVLRLLTVLAAAFGDSFFSQD